MIRIPKKVYRQFLRFAIENANPNDPQNWKECIGLILGKITDRQVLVTDIVPMGAGTAVFVDITDYEKVFSLISVSKIEEGEVIVGWAHTHPGLGLFLSQTDIQTQELYQKMHPKAFALVLDPTRISKDFSGFNIYRLDKNWSKPIIMDYSFDQPVNFVETRNSVTLELYPVPPILIPTPVPINTNSEAFWNGINIKISGTTDTKVNQLFQVKLSVVLPFRQYFRIEYSIETDNLIEAQFSPERIFHETLSSGFLGIFTFRLKKKGVSQIKFHDLTLSTYLKRFQGLPDLSIETLIED
ncbi:MAG: Mov34/MPN/PAD-1 family protein [Candidatus Hodarchaeales archaeon]|jgi:proteasome lid subunit RPN8/RPN11